MTQWELEAIAAYYTGDSEPRGYHLIQHDVKALVAEIKRLQVALGATYERIAAQSDALSRVAERESRPTKS